MPAIHRLKEWKYSCHPWLLLLAVLLADIANAQQAEDDGNGIHLQMGGYIHFSSSEDFSGAPLLVAIERLRPKRYYYGLALFNNSFDQFSQFLYIGREFPWQRVHEDFRFRLSLGVVHGYRDEHKDELPLNYKGYSPGLVPSIGFKGNQTTYDLALLANAGLLLTLGYEF